MVWKNKGVYMAFWLVKSDPDTYSWIDLLKDRKTDWDGVRNYQARNYLIKMEMGDFVLIYESQSTKAAVGIAKVTKSYFLDRTTYDGRWVAVELTAERSLNNPVSLEMIKSEPELSSIAIIRQSLLSVMPLTESEYDKFLRLSE